MNARKVAAAVAALASLLLSAPLSAATYVYVSNADDGDIGMYALQRDGSLKPGARFKAEKVVMPMSVSPDKRFLVAGVRSKPYSAYTYAIDRSSGALNLVGTGPLAESFPYISLDHSGRFLFGASYGGHLVSVNPVGTDGRVGEPIQVIPTARNAHSIRIDNTNRYVFAPHLGTDQVFQFVFDQKTGRLHANTPPVLQLAQGTGPRHIIISSDNRFAYLLSELVATVSTLALDAGTGQLKLVSTARATARQQARPGYAARRRGYTWRQPSAARHQQRHLGLRPAPHAEREAPLRPRAHR
jgi:6-phosphogluconolactonase